MLKGRVGKIAATTMSHTDLSLMVKAIRFAAEKHRHQRRKDVEASPYINHPIAVAAVLANEAGVEDVSVLCACILHDTIEDTDTTEAELLREFGPAITALVAERTDDRALPRAERKALQIAHAEKLSPGARLVKLADKISNLRDILATPPKDWPPSAKEEYFDWASSVVERIRGSHAGLEATFDSLIARRVEFG